MSVNSDNDSILNSKTQVCAWLGLPKRTLERLVRAGTFPRPTQFGLKRKSYWLREDINAFIQKLREQKTAQPSPTRSVIAKRIKKTLAEKEKVRGYSGSDCA